MTFLKYFLARENAVQNLQGNTGEAVKNMILQVLNQPQYAQQKAAFERLMQAPQLYQAFMQEVAQQSNNTYKLSPAQYIQLINKHSLKAAGAKLPAQLTPGAPATPPATATAPTTQPQV